MGKVEKVEKVERVERVEKMKKLIFVAAAMAAVAGTAAESRTRCFDKPWVVVAEDFGAFFRDESNEMTKEGVEKYVDSILESGTVTHVFWGAVAGRAHYDAKATEPIWSGLANPETVYGIERSIAFVPCTGAKPEELAANRRWAENAKKLHDAGVDFCRVLVDRTHAKGAQAWLTLRMVDMQYGFEPRHFRTPTYFAQHPEFVSKAGGHGGGNPNYACKETREWFSRVVAETAARYKDVDGIEIDIITGGETWAFAREDAPDPGDKSELLNAYLGDLKKTIVESTGNGKAKMAVRLAYDTNFQFYRNVNSDLTMPGDILIPWSESESTPCVWEWADRDRYGQRRIMPAVPMVAQFPRKITVPQLAGRLNQMRGRGFPGVVLVGLEKAPADVRRAVLTEGLAGLDKGVKGPRELNLLGNSPLIEWKRVAWGYLDARTPFPWALDRPWKYEFALQEGSVAAKSVVAEMSFTGANVPKEIYLNGRKSTACRNSGSSKVYVFPKTAVFGGVNQLYIPAETKEDDLELEDVKTVVTKVNAATVRIDM